MLTDIIKVNYFNKEVRSMKSVSLTIFLAFIFLLVGFLHHAKAESDNPVVQTGEGVGKIVTSPIKIPENVVEDAEEKDPVTGTVTGTVKGTGEGVEQIGEGTADVITAPLKIFK